MRNAIAETTESVEQCGRIQWEKETTVEMPVSVKGRASVNVQRLLEPLQMCRKRFWPGRKAFHTLPRVKFGGMLPTVCAVSHVSTRGLRGCNERSVRVRRSNFPNDISRCRIEIKIHRLLSLSQKIRDTSYRASLPLGFPVYTVCQTMPFSF